MTEDYVLITNGAEGEDAIDDLLTRKMVGLDFETTGVDPRRDVPLLCGVDEYIFPCTGWAKDVWAYLLRKLVQSTATIKVEYNAGFEGMFFTAAGIHQRRVADPMLGDMLLYAGHQEPPGFFSLGQALRRYLYVEHDKVLQTSFVGADPRTFAATDAQMRYLRRDVAYLPSLSDAVARKCSQEGLTRTWKLENRYSQAVAQMHYHGVLVDTDGYRKELEAVNAEFDQLERSVSEALTPSILEVRRRKYQALKGPEDEWKAKRDASYADIAAQKELKHATLVFGGSRALARTWELEQQRLWKEANPQPPVAKMNHSPILVTSPDQIYAALNEMGIKVDNTEKETLILAQAGRSAEQVEILKNLGELSSVKKVRANEGPALLERLQDGNRLTTRYHQLRARTGRISSSKWSDSSRCSACGTQQRGIHVDDTEGTVTCQSCARVAGPRSFGQQWGANNQNLTARFKQYVHPGPGRKFVIFDYSQVELRIPAHMILAENPHATDVLVQAFRDDLDPHALMGESITGIPYDEIRERAVVRKEPDMVRLRKGMKTVNFSSIFGTGAPTMAVKIYVETGDTTKFSKSHIDAAQERIDAFWSLNPTLAVLRDRIGDMAISTGVAETLGGRRRYFDVMGADRRLKQSIRRQALATSVQGTAADIAKEAQNLLWDAIVECDPEGAWLWSVTHDEVAMECTESMAPAWEETMRCLMTTAFENYITLVPCGLDGGIHDNWGH